MVDRAYIILDKSVLTPKLNEEANCVITDEILLGSSPEESVTCNVCRKCFGNDNALQNHIRFEHASDDSDNDSDSISALMMDQKSTPILRMIPIEANPQVDQCMDKICPGDKKTWIIVKVRANLNDKRKKSEGQLRSEPKISNELITIRGPFQCSYASTSDPTKQCNRIFYDCCLFSLHFREEHTKRRKAALRCQVCEKRLDRDFSATNTNAQTFNPESYYTFSCRSCGLVFADGAQYDEHNRLIHAKSKPYQCTICTKRFTQQGGLQQHVRAHSGIRPFACTFCPKAFTQKAGLDQHLRTHTKIKPFKCVVCTKCFSQSVHLRQHMRTHTNIQPFECNVCGRKFKQSSHLTFHMRSHSGIQGECMPTDIQNKRNLAEILGLSLQQVEHGGAIYYSAKLSPSSLLNNDENVSPIM